MEKGIKAKGKEGGGAFWILGFGFIKRECFSHSFVKVHRVGLKTSLFCRFWISISCNLSVRLHNLAFSFSILCF